MDEGKWEMRPRVRQKPSHIELINQDKKFRFYCTSMGKLSKGLSLKQKGGMTSFTF